MEWKDDLTVEQRLASLESMLGGAIGKIILLEEMLRDYDMVRQAAIGAFSRTHPDAVTDLITLDDIANPKKPKP